MCLNSPTLSACLVSVLAAFSYRAYQDSALGDCRSVTLSPLGRLEPNALLAHADHLFEGDIIGPEAMVVEESGSVITGLADGRIVRIYTENDGKLATETLVRTGVEHTEDGRKCGDSIEFESTCGRPLGLTITRDGKKLVIADGYKGLLELDLSTKQLVSLAQGSGAGNTFFLINSVQESPDGGTLYFTETSTDFRRNRIFYAVFSGNPTGRLLAYHRTNRSVTVLAEKLLLPNGIVYDHQDKCLIFAMTITKTLHKYCPGAGKGIEVFTEGIPGTLDNLHKYTHPETNSNGYLLGIGSKMALPFNLIAALKDMPMLRRLLIGILPISYEALINLVPRYGMLVFLNEKGQIVTTLQDPSGRTSWISEAVMSNGSLWMGSWLSPFLGRIAWDNSQEGYNQITKAFAAS